MRDFKLLPNVKAWSFVTLFFLLGIGVRSYQKMSVVLNIEQILFLFAGLLGFWTVSVSWKKRIVKNLLILTGISAISLFFQNLLKNAGLEEIEFNWATWRIILLTCLIIEFCSEKLFRKNEVRMKRRELWHSTILTAILLTLMYQFFPEIMNGENLMVRSVVFGLTIVVATLSMKIMSADDKD